MISILMEHLDKTDEVSSSCLSPFVKLEDLDRNAKSNLVLPRVSILLEDHGNTD